MRPGQVLFVLLATLMGWEAQACRCAPQVLANYFEQADVVTFARLSDWAAAGDDVQLEFTPASDPFKGSLAGQAVITGSSTASCGLPLERDGNYLLFARRDETRTATVLVNTCDGSRLFDARDGRSLPDFEDVPARFVPTQLAMLQGMAALQAVQAVGPTDRLIGLLDLKALAHGGVVLARSEAAADAPIVARITDMQELPSREASYEYTAALVVGQVPGWYALRLSRDDPSAVGWIAAEEAGTYWPLSQLLERRLSYLTSAWDGLLWVDGPGAGRVARRPRARETPVTVEAVESVAGSVWVKVAVLAASPCEGGADAAKAIAGGWVPAHGASAAPTVWFYSRGC